MGSRPEGGRGFPLRGHGIGIPSLEEVLALQPAVRLNVELKDASALGPLVDLVRASGALDRLCLGSEHDELAAALHRALPEACHFFPRDALAAFVLSVRGGEEVVDDARYAVLDMPLEWEGVRVFDRAVAEAARARGKWVNVWTLDEPEVMREALGEGVGGIMTDRPDVLRHVLEAASRR